MNSKVVQIALRICLIKEEFSENEILEAIKLLEDHGSASILLDYLAGRKAASKTRRSKHKSKSTIEQRSRVIISLQDEEPEKFELLSEFDSMIRQGKILSELDDIKRLGEQLSKDFAPKNSRRDAIDKLIDLLAKRQVDEIRTIIRTVSSSDSKNKDNDYQELARFIITGRSSQAKTI